MTARITPLSTPPNRNDPDNFVERTDTFLSEIPVFGTEANALADEVNALAAQVGTGNTNVNVKAAAAAASATEAAASATAAAASAAAAVVSATVATNKASDASASAAAADAYAVEASKLNLGAKSSPPTVDNQGEPLRPGAFYLDTPSGTWRGWDGTSWQLPTHSVAGVSSFNGATGDVTYNPEPHIFNFTMGVI